MNTTTQPLTSLELTFPNQTNFYQGKVRQVYTIDDNIMVVITLDTISAFDHVLPCGIPHKGVILNHLAGQALFGQSIVKSWLSSIPHPRVAIGYKCKPYPVEMVIRGYLTGHAWREYKAGKRMICGVPMPDGMKEHDKFPEPIITPATKAEKGEHDEDISREEIIARGLVPEDEYDKLEQYTRELFQYGTKTAAQRGLILVDTKYEFGTRNGEIYVIDEVHTPDSSRFFYLEGYEELQFAGEPQRQLSKEFAREWLMEHGFQGKEGQAMPELGDDFVVSVSDRYIELFEQISGKKYPYLQSGFNDTPKGIYRAVTSMLDRMMQG